MARIFDTRDVSSDTITGLLRNSLSVSGNLILLNIDLAVKNTAFHMREKTKLNFINSKALYKRPTSKYDELSKAVMVGALKDSMYFPKITVHALGPVNDPEKHLYKARFFVSGTIYRKQTKKAGRSIKPFSKGLILPNDALLKAVGDANSFLRLLEIDEVNNNTRTRINIS